MRILGNLKLTLLTVASLVAFGVAGTNIAYAVVEFDQNVTPDIIFGTGNANGSFTTDRQNGIELGLRGKLRFPPQNTFNSNGDGTYSFATGGPGGQTAEWSFEWSVNTNFNGTSGLNLDDLSYEMGLDADPGPGTNFLVFDPITPNLPPLNAPFFDHAIGDNSTGNGAGTEATDNASYLTLLANNNVAQNSWRYDFFLLGPLAGFDPTVDGTYAIYLLARNSSGEVVAKVNIQILVGNAKPAPDHFQCYKVKKETKPNPKPIVDLDDQFVWRENVEVKKKAEFYCTPVDKNNEGITNRDNNLTCYKVKGFNPHRKVTIENQFGEQSFELEKSKLLCVPSTQLEVTDVSKKGDEDDDD